MSSGLAICSVCHREIHQGVVGIGWPEHRWWHCNDRSAICEGARAEYPRNYGDIVGAFCGMDDINLDGA